MDYGQKRVAELKIELKNRGANVTGTKEKLIERLNDYDRNNNFKPNANNDSNLSSQILYTIEWPEEKLYKSVDSKTVLPNFDIVNINTYFLELYKEGIGMSDYSVVHRRGYNMLQNNYLLALVTANTNTHIFFKGQVHSENTKSLTYFASIAICNQSGCITQSVCECVAGKGPKAICKHVSVLCYAILKFRDQNVWQIKHTPTQKKQVWHAPKKNKLDVSPQKAENLSYEISEYNVSKKKKRSMCYDPRPQSSNSLENEWAATVRNKVINYCSLSQKRIGLCGILHCANMQDVIHDHDYLPFPLHHQLILNKISDQNIPIEINSRELLNWLISRRHCNDKWQSFISITRDKIKSVLQNLPADEQIAQLLVESHINYFHCKKILEILTKIEADSKNVFDSYGSQRLKDWQEIVRLYEKDNLYLAEVAQILITNITHEIPIVKKQIQKLEQSDQELQRKFAEYKKSENLVRSEFLSICKNLNISGNNIKQELLDLIEELPTVYNEVELQSQNLRKIVEFYAAFLQFVLGCYPDGGCVPTVQHVIDKGNTTTYQWIHGEKPLEIGKPENVNENLNSPYNLVLNNNDNAGSREEINSNESGEIDWGDIKSVENSKEEINANLNVPLKVTGIINVVDCIGKAAMKNEALTILDNSTIRADFINELLELDAFLRMRLYELNNKCKRNILSMSQVEQIPPILQLSSVESIQNMMDSVKIVSSIMLDTIVQHLHYIKHSPRYVDALTETLQQKQGIIEKMVLIQNDINVRRDKLSLQINSSYNIMMLLIKITKEIQILIQQDLSKKYHDRVVRLTGVINNI